MTSDFYNYPLLPPEDLVKIGSEVVEPIFKGEPLSAVFGLPNSGRSSLLRQLFYYGQVVSSEWKEKIGSKIWIVVNLPAEKKVINYLRASPYLKGEQKSLDGLNLDQAVSWLIEDRKEEIVFVINSLDSCTNQRRKEILSQVINVYYQYPEKIKFVIGQGCDVAENSDLIWDLVRYYQANQFFLSLNDERQIEHFLSRQAELGKQSLADKLTSKFVSLTGGYLPLMIRFLEKAEFLDRQVDALDDPALDKSLSTLWESLDEKSRISLTRLSLGLETPKLSTYLTKTKLVYQGQIFSPLFKKWIKQKISQEAVIKQKDGDLYLDSDLKLDEILAPQEYQVIKLLWDKKDEIVTREEIAKTMWGKKCDQKYSDWAIDRVVANIRKKSLIGQKLETKKGRGYVLRLD